MATTSLQVVPRGIGAPQCPSQSYIPPSPQPREIKTKGGGVGGGGDSNNKSIKSSKSSIMFDDVHV